ncbi:hypothetical protein EUTSA_v10019768mg [Eutrema salsugineum]|uniref:Protein CPR-5 n=1 Tax=Eutrema salsugineum TaxID=72664 RepID=V4JRY4_EUTSA|nr:hypothetical protein EUTSA_v10019768mg [Eutrema salsugineum]
MMTKKIKPSPLEKRNLKPKKTMNNDEASSSCSSSSNPNYTRRVSRVAYRLRNPTVRLGMARRSVGERQAEALARPLVYIICSVYILFMRYLTFVHMVLQRNAAGQNLHVDDLAVISTSAVKESLANVYGDKLGSFATNFERSFKSTLSILKLTNEYTFPQHSNNNNVATSTIDECSDTELSAMETSSATSAYEVIQGERSEMSLTTFERRRLEEKARANDLKTMEIGLKMTKIAISSESNNLEKAKLEMAASKAAFKDEKFKTELEDSRRDDFVVKTMDWLGVSVFIMVACMIYGASVFSQEKIKGATSICEPSKEKSYLWWGFSWLNTESINILICRLGVWLKYFGVLMILVFTYLIMSRSSQTRPVTFIVVFLSIVCGLAGEFCVETLGGNSDLWLYLWQVFCVLLFLANVFTDVVYGLIYGPVTVTQGTRLSRRDKNTWVPYWARRCFFFGLIRFVLPAITGLLAFATFGEWIDHFFGGRGSKD